MPEALPWEFFVDRGGTFTDVIGVAPDGTRHVTKRLSSDTAALEGMRAILEQAGALAARAPLPRCRVRLGTTIATNALLERRGARALLITHEGLGEVFEIGTQQRPELFALRIEKPPPLHARTLETRGRDAPDGREIAPEDERAFERGLAEARGAGCTAAAIALLHGHAHPAREARLAARARDAGFDYVVASHELAREPGLLARGETAIADAVLTPLLRDYVRALERALPGSSLRFMQSSGGATSGARFRGPAALLSGPAGGAVGAAQVARSAGFPRAVGFDMGGTSTDVCWVQDGAVELGYETELAGVHLRVPSLRVHSVAAGGGSLCRFDGFRFTVGPESAGADPGPLCYGRPGARELALTDVNVALGRLPASGFPFALDAAAVERALDALVAELARAGQPRSRDEAAAGFLEVANATMAEAIRQVSVARGVDPRGAALVGFGGAAGQHVCAVARALGIDTILLHPLASVLSAWGIGLAELAWDGQADLAREPLADGRAPASAVRAFEALEEEGRAALEKEGAGRTAIRATRSLDLRYAGTERALSVAAPPDGDFDAAFARAHAARFGYARPGRGVECVTARVAVRAPGGMREGRVVGVAGAVPSQAADVAVAWFPGLGRVGAPVVPRASLAAGARLEGPALVVDPTTTLVLDPGFALEVAAGGTLVVRDLGAPPRRPAEDLSRPDPVRLEVLGGRFMSIAEQMGAVLRNTASSTNIKERLDYSCAVFDRDGGLVANAPHIPVHLGAMGETVRAVKGAFPALEPGDVVATNDPSAGGSHLPDVTVVTPVFLAGERAPRFFVASRGHHADIGGKAPGSMPSDSRTLEEEGVVIPPLRCVRAGRFDEAGLRALLGGARYPARSPDDNVADLEAMIAANRVGAELVGALVRERGREAVEITMRQLQAAAAGKVAREIGRLPGGVHRFADRLDDGTPVVVAVTIDGERMRVDFTGTGSAVGGNLNAPRAVVHAAVLYVLRCLVAERIPLNGGCLEPVEIVLPPGSLLDPPPGSAVVGGNVETSQRVVDVLLGALGLAAASQGTMNNVAFGDARFGYYETIGGGAGAGPGFDGASGVHVHMTNTRITDPEILEIRHPVRIVAFRRRRGSGGAGRFHGGDGLVRGYEFLAPVTASLLCERRAVAPFGLEGGAPGAMGRNLVERRDGAREEVGGHATVALGVGDRLWIETPGGGGFGRPQ
ncbi:MAG TPA: hydantoinase B/oxoprolinase family protein [Myxococcota bacterium]|nr:hydantoinase B/oxoprolinase family protein [Myxococcota bacterium]